MARRPTYLSVASLQADNRACRACAEAGHQIESAPVVEGHAGQRAMIIGQAPGAIEGEEGRPWRGRAGRTLRRWLALDDDAFAATFYCCSVTRCYPGKSPGGRGDRTPSRAELDLCSFWLEQELALVAPELVLTVGGLASARVLGIRRLTEHVGERFRLGRATAIPLPHPSGASGWLNARENRDRLEAALAEVRDELASLA
jgi:uracil-DNA glycosylase